MDASIRGPSGDTESIAADILATVDLGVLAVDASGIASFANRSWERLTGQVDGRWRGTGWQSVLDGDGVDVVPGMEVVVAGGPPRVLRLDSTPMAGGTLGSLLTARDVSAERARTEELTRAAMRDPLTGLWNRNRFLEFLVQALARQHRERERRAAVFFVDIDDLKATNDRDGHAAGDELLVAVATCIASAVRPGDVVARHGGDEFMVLCDDVADSDETGAIAGRILDAIAAAPDVPCSITLGIAMTLGPDDDPADVVARADADMYRLKRRPGRGGALTGADDEQGRPSLVVAAAELAGPLATATGFVHVLRSSWSELDPAERNDALDAVARLLGGLGRTVDHVVTLGQRMERVGVPEIVSIPDAIERALRATPPPDGTSVRVDVSTRTCGLPLRADDLHHVLVQLLGNSYRCRPSSVVVRTHTVAAHVVVEIEDDAVLQDPTTHTAARNGAHISSGGNQNQRQLGLRETGPELALVAELVEAVGGVLRHERSPDRSVVRIRIPLVDGRATGPGAAWR